ncbi:MAG: NADH:flavin oxidoreductase [Dehalobacter sp.]|nr:NADH:flavin oxidoreductase [Dehalobacter sp.]
MSGLFSSLKIKGMAMSNRLVMPPMALDKATSKGEVTEGQIQHYLLRARSCPETEKRPAGSSRAGIGLVIVEHSYIEPQGKSHPRQLGIYDDFLVPGLQLLVNELHQEGVPVGIQITHAGARAMDAPVGPSAVFCPDLSRWKKTPDPNDLPRELSTGEISRLVEKFAEAACRVKKAGFDFVEIHGAHGYLLNQFYSPLTNHRTDEYGGFLENRLRFSCEVIRAVREALGPEMPVFYRLGADDRLPGGNTLQDSIRAVPLLVEAGIDCLDLSGGICGYLKSGPEGFFAYMAEALKPVAGIPVLVTGGIKNARNAVMLIQENTTDLIGVGRSLLNDPDWARNAWREINQYKDEETVGV